MMAKVVKEIESARPEGCYCRLFHPPAEPLLEDQERKLIQLGESMRYLSHQEGVLTPRVGYTYFAQFVGHDLTDDRTPFNGPYREPEVTPNYHSAYLDLDVIYGGGPNISPDLYEGEEGLEFFRIGKTSNGKIPRDVPIWNGSALVSDTRNLDNLVLRQLHALFLKFHNEAVRQLSHKSPTIVGSENIGGETIFRQAQRLVRWHYQWIVRHDLLPRILNPSYWAGEFRSLLYAKTKIQPSIPIEFSLAAYRFGHSMVRRAYALNCKQRRLELFELMRLGHRPQEIEDAFLVEWGRFFDGLPASGPVASSSFLDTSITIALHDLPQSVLDLCSKLRSPITMLNLPVRTLLRGARTRLRSGQEVAETLLRDGVVRSAQVLTSTQLIQDTHNRSGSVLFGLGLHKNTPLFYYLLKEAELNGLGRTLGAVGSYIVGSTIERSLSSDPEGYFAHVGPAWKLPLWRFPNGRKRTVNSMIDIIRLVGDATLLPECERRARRVRSYLPKPR
jgi:hypothetical protein